MDKTEKTQQIVGTVIGLIAVPLLIGWGMKLSEKKAEKYPWSVSFYINDILKDSSKRSEFKTLEKCREWAKEKAEKMDLEEGKWNYECGRGCEYTDQSIEGGRQVQTFECVEISK